MDTLSMSETWLRINNTTDSITFTEDSLMKAVKYCEMLADMPKTQQLMSGRVYWYLIDYEWNNTYSLNTTVSDLLEVDNRNLEFNSVYDLTYDNNPQLTSIKMANNKEFREVLKFTPKNTLSVSQIWISPKEDGAYFFQKYPYLQNEEIVKKFNNDTTESELTSAYNLLVYDKRVTAKLPEQKKENFSEIGERLHRLLCISYYVRNSWAVVYVYKNVMFLIPINNISELKDALKNRDKINGRKRVMPTVVKSHKRKNGEEVASYVRGIPWFSIHGREFCFLAGTDYLPLMFHKNKNGWEKIKKLEKDNLGFYS